MKRSYDAEPDDYPSPYLESPTSASPATEKRTRSRSPPMVVGPLIFNTNGTDLETEMFKASPSNLPGVHRLSASPATKTRLWSPQWPVTMYTEPFLDRVLQAINGKCIFIFDTRQLPDEPLLQNPALSEWLLLQPVIQRYGIIVSKFELPHMAGLSAPIIPFIQEVTGELASICHFRDYLGPTAVCVKNNEIVATSMLSRSPEILQTTLDHWGTV